jgi:hypothetical protein
MTKAALPENVPKALDAIADVVLAYKPKAKTEGAKKRKKRAAKLARKPTSNPPLLSKHND